MQVLTKHYPKNCLLTVMDRYSAVVHNMEQVVMIPSLLRDVHLTGPGEQAQAPDLYTYFTMLKTIRVEVDHGLLPREEWRAKLHGSPCLWDHPSPRACAHKANEAEDDEAVETEEAGEERISRELDLEAQFHLHFSSLHHILTHLTQKAQEVTRKYQEMTGQVL
ncbi:Thyroid hormone-inducible hepatic protein [Heterocephalus glaber]|uniref:Thyroid hormone-inducible hepatic protein n=1 Tax=Heterocephalus glaber TaxID=10181 RepID=G5AW67_HETGA|nr:Thyroid hormone-inducible hepatic protein [Heterocephalus glaber]